MAQKKNSPKKPLQYHKPSADFRPSDTSNLQEGMKVEHPKFGFGKVNKMDTSELIKKQK